MQPLPESIPLPASRQPTPSQVFIADERWERLLSGLTSAQRQVIDLLRQGHTHEEISGTLNIPIGTSKSHLFQARSKLRVLLADFAPEWVS